MGLGMIEAARFTPPTFAEGLENWLSGDGVAGDPRYDLSSDASLVTGDSDFGVCLELRKTIELQKHAHALCSSSTSFKHFRLP